MNFNPLLHYPAGTIHPGFSVDCVVLSFHKRKIKVLLRDFGFGSFWALPGGFVFHHESADEAVLRIINFYTGLQNVFLRQFRLFSDPKRTIFNQNEDFIAKYATPENNGQWLLQRFISMGYYALVKYEDVVIADSDKKRLKWYDLSALPNLYSDHEQIITEAMKMLRITHPVIPIGRELLPEAFTMGNLRKIYEIILDKELDRRNFQRKILSEGIVIPIEGQKSAEAYNAPIMYRFRSRDAKVSFL